MMNNDFHRGRGEDFTVKHRIGIGALIFLVTIGSCACTSNVRIDAGTAFSEGRAWSGEVSPAELVGARPESGERNLFLESGDTCFFIDKSFYGIRAGSDTLIFKKNQVDSFAVRRVINCETKLFWYDNWKHGWYLDKDSSFSPLKVDGHPVVSLMTMENERIKIARPGLRFNCVDKFWTGKTITGSDVRVGKSEIKEMTYEKPDALGYAIVTMLSIGFAGAVYAVLEPRLVN